MTDLPDEVPIEYLDWSDNRFDQFEREGHPPHQAEMFTCVERERVYIFIKRPTKHKRELILILDRQAVADLARTISKFPPEPLPPLGPPQPNYPTGEHRLAGLGLTISWDETEAGVDHVILLDQGSPAYHWYPTRGTLFAGVSPDQHIDGRFEDLHDVADAVEARRRGG